MSVLGETRSLSLKPKAPFNFNANFHKPSHFPSSDSAWEPDGSWVTMVWQDRILGLKFENLGTADDPRVKMMVNSRRPLSDDFVEGLKQEVGWRFNFDQDVSGFCLKYRNDKFLGEPIRRLKGMKPVAANSLYETLMVYVVLQNATVRRSVQMLENLFGRFGRRVSFDGRTLSAFWGPAAVAKSTEEELRALKLGYRAKAIRLISRQFVEGAIDEYVLRRMSKEEVQAELDRLYGIGPASVEYLLFEDFYFLDALQTVPPWEQRIMSRLLFGKRLVPAERILRFFRERYPGYEKLAFHYLWEDLFWRRRRDRIEWLEKEIRL